MKRWRGVVDSKRLTHRERRNIESVVGWNRERKLDRVCERERERERGEKEEAESCSAISLRLTGQAAWLRDAAELFWDSCNISGFQLSEFPSATAARDHKMLSNNGSLQEFLSQGAGNGRGRGGGWGWWWEKRGLEKCVLVLLSELAELS